MEPVLDKLLSGVSFQMAGAIDPLAFAKMDPLFARRLVLTPQTRTPGKIHYTLDESEPDRQSARGRRADYLDRLGGAEGAAF